MFAESTPREAMTSATAEEHTSLSQRYSVLQAKHQEELTELLTRQRSEVERLVETAG